jgi:hypothetical protein
VGDWRGSRSKYGWSSTYVPTGEAATEATRATTAVMMVKCILKVQIESGGRVKYRKSFESCLEMGMLEVVVAGGWERDSSC